MQLTTITLHLDPDDARDIRRAIHFRSMSYFPSSQGNLPGRLLGEICRGWLETAQLPPELARQWYPGSSEA